eukprot:362261-Chlamydomonas_euryale.AAC.2
MVGCARQTNCGGPTERAAAGRAGVGMVWNGVGTVWECGGGHARGGPTQRAAAGCAPCVRDQPPQPISKPTNCPAGRAAAPRRRACAAGQASRGGQRP